MANKIIAGMEDAVAYVRGDASRARVSTVDLPHDIDVRSIRSKMGLSQQEFSLKFGFPLPTLRNWEQGRRRPEGSARVLLTLIERIPQAIEQALRAA